MVVEKLFFNLKNLIELNQTSWKKILFLCLSFIFVFSGVFGFAGKALAQHSMVPGTLEDFNKGQEKVKEVQSPRGKTVS